MPRYIDEDRLYSNIEEKYKVAQGDARKAYNDVLDTICEIPTADVQEVRHGHWIKMKNFCLIPTYECSLCGRQIKTIGNARKNAPYCHCGARMDEEEQE